MSNSHKVKFIYETMIDHWSDGGWVSLFKHGFSSVSHAKIQDIDSEEFKLIVDFLYKLAKYTDWEGDIRSNDIYIHDVGYTILIGLKQDNNGLTYVGAPFKIDKEQQKALEFLTTTDPIEIK